MGGEQSKNTEKEQNDDEVLLVPERYSKPSNENQGTFSQTADSATKSLRLLLIGKTGHGKSATGNSILEQKAFKVAANTKSETKKVKEAWAKYGPYNIQVVDGPGLAETHLTRTEDIQEGCANMATALSMCNGGVHAFLLVIKLGTRFTPEERTVFSNLETIFGAGYLRDRGIIVITGGDDFHRIMKEENEEEEDDDDDIDDDDVDDDDDYEEETLDESFQKWCQKQNEPLFKMCPRIILFNNRLTSKQSSKKDNQRNKLLQLAKTISQEKGLYTSEHFKMYADMREKLIKEHNLPLLKENIQRIICLLIADLGNISEKSTVEDLQHLERRIYAVYQEIKDEDQNEQFVKKLINVLRTMQNTTENLKTAIIEGNTGNIEFHVKELQKQKRKLKRTKDIPWEVIGVVTGALLLTGGAAVACFGACVALPAVACTAVILIGKTLQVIGSVLFAKAVCVLKPKIDDWRKTKKD